MGILPSNRCSEQIRTTREVNLRFQREAHSQIVKNVTHSHLPLEEFLKINILSRQPHRRAKRIG